MNKVKKWLALAVFAALPWQAQAETAAESLHVLLKGYDRFSAQFEQISRKEQSTSAEVSKGTVKVARPGRFRWETETPFPQLIVSDGSYLWVYDPDLEQATRKPVKEEQANGAALILNGDMEQLNRKFSITRLMNQEGGSLFELLPVDPQSSFQRIRLFFSGDMMAELMLQDVLGQQTTIMFHNPKLNESMKDSLFEFVPPKGTDVIMSDES